jgi:ankyrin repeat protein
LNNYKLFFVALLSLVLFSVSIFSTTIHEAISKGDLELVRHLIEKDSSLVNITDNNEMTPLHFAVIAESIETVSYLIDKGANINAVNNIKETPLHIAAKKGKSKITEILLKNGADVTVINVWDRAPLRNATEWGHDRKTVELLINADSDVNRKNSRGDRVLFSSLFYGKKEVIDLLIDRGAVFPDDENKLRQAVYITTSNGMERPFNLAVKKCELMGLEWWDGIPITACARGGSVIIAKALIANGTNYKDANSYGLTPLHIGSVKGNFEFIEYLLSLDIDIDFKSKVGKTAYNYAVENSHSDIAELLIKKGSSDLPQEFPKLEGDYLGQQIPFSKPELFAQGIVSTYGFNSQHSPAVFSPDGNEVYWTKEFKGPILFMKRDNGKWTAPKKASFNSEFGDGEPIFSVDGNKIYFLSLRPIEEGGRADKENIWYVKRTVNGWSDAKPVSPLINEYDLHWLFSVAADGSIYFSSIRDGGFGNRDIYVSDFVDGEYTEPVNLGEIINSQGVQHTPYIAPDESYMIFVSTGNTPNMGNIRFVISYKDQDGNWGEPIDLGDDLNSISSALCPYVTPDGKYMFFIGAGDIYWVSADFIEKLKPEELK